MIVGNGEGMEPFKMCRLPLGAYQQATFVNLTDTESLEPEFTPPAYTVTIRSAEPGFVVREAMLLLDSPAIDKFIVALHAAAHPTLDNIATLEALMATQEYGQWQR